MVAGDPATRTATSSAIVDGYILLAAVATAICVVAMGCAVFIRHRGVASPEPLPSPTSPVLEPSRAPLPD